MLNTLFPKSSRIIRIVVLCLLVVFLYFFVNAWFHQHQRDTTTRTKPSSDSKPQVVATTSGVVQPPRSKFITRSSEEEDKSKNKNVFLDEWASTETSEPVLSKRVIIMPSSQDHLHSSLPKVVVMAIHTRDQYQRVRNMVACLQQMIRSESGNETVLPFVYGVNLDHEMENEVEDWKYVSFERLKMYEAIERSLEHYMRMKQNQKLDAFEYDMAMLWMDKILSDVRSKFVNVPIKLVTTDPLDLSAISSYFFLHDTCHSSTPPDDITLERKKFSLVVPFIDKQVSNLHEQITRWRTFKPCIGQSPYYKSTVDLIFYYHTNRSLEIEDSILGLLGESTASGSFVLKQEFECISPIIIFRYAQLTPEEDVYPVCANHMFYRLIGDSQHYHYYRFFFLSEPDTFAIRDNWLNKIIQVAYTLSEINDFWICGSVYRGVVSFKSDGRNLGDPRGGDLVSLSSNIHVNGNAIYSTKQVFRTFLKTVESDVALFPYDTAVMHYLFEYGWRATRDVWHHFQFQEFIINLWKTDWTEEEVRSLYPFTYLVHGKRHNPSAIRDKLDNESEQEEMNRLLAGADGIEQE